MNSNEDPKTRALEVNVFNRQSRLPIDEEALGPFLEGIAARLQAPGGFSVVLADDAFLAQCNSRYRGKQGPTDVLSFPNQPDAWEEEIESPPYLGDILISVDAAERQRKASLDQEIRTLSLHGLLHLLGYDHETDNGEMESLEAELKKELRLP